MIICLEGASAVGKTSTSLEIVKSTNTYVVPEVNLFFARPTGVSNTWYLERQVVLSHINSFMNLLIKLYLVLFK
ncbi:hypothetical protein ACFVR2_19050 [Gottfriedia sp. NPDC057991]|uniref:hypothetical protein n=1 Tax=Gottfriedia sp. NPDC057991 TaxID=3346298 RepID=UPI0036DF2FEC